MAENERPNIGSVCMGVQAIVDTINGVLKVFLPLLLERLWDKEIEQRGKSGIIAGDMGQLHCLESSEDGLYPRRVLRVVQKTERLAKTQVRHYLKTFIHVSIRWSWK